MKLSLFYHDGNKWLIAAKQAGAIYYRNETKRSQYPEREAEDFWQWRRKAEERIYQELYRI